MVWYKPGGKGEKAYDRLKAIQEEANNIKSIIQRIAATLHELVDKTEMKSEPTSKQQCNRPQKVRGMISWLPERIDFTCNDLKFYIDFGLVGLDPEDTADVKGSIVYGTNRTLCFRECIFPEGGECKICQRVSRCDGLEDKPLIQFTVDRHGIIKSSTELDDEWRIKDSTASSKKKVSELHFRALDHIWKDALNWTNENILP